MAIRLTPSDVLHMHGLGVRVSGDLDSGAPEEVDAETEAAFDASLIRAQGSLLREASAKIIGLSDELKRMKGERDCAIRTGLHLSKRLQRATERGDNYRIWFQMCLAAIVLMIIVASITWGK